MLRPINIFSQIHHQILFSHHPLCLLPDLHLKKPMLYQEGSLVQFIDIGVEHITPLFRQFDHVNIVVDLFLAGAILAPVELPPLYDS